MLPVGDWYYAKIRISGCGFRHGSILLYRMQDAGYISGRDVTVTTQNGRKRNRVLYHLEPSGRERLTELKAEFDRVQQGIQSVFQNSAPIGYKGEDSNE